MIARIGDAMFAPSVCDVEQRMWDLGARRVSGMGLGLKIDNLPDYSKEGTDAAADMLAEQVRNGMNTRTKKRMGAGSDVVYASKPVAPGGGIRQSADVLVVVAAKGGDQSGASDRIMRPTTP